jgi:hypothetical protein
MPLFAPPGITIKTVRRWRLTLDAADLIGGGGTDFPVILESAVDEVEIDISKTLGPTAPWRVDVRSTEVNWRPEYRLYVRRSSDGLGDGSIAGGTVYQEITGVDQVFFSGTGDRTKIELQFRLEGVSVGVPLDTYTADVHYTVTEL